MFRLKSAIAAAALLFAIPVFSAAGEKIASAPSAPVSSVTPMATAFWARDWKKVDALLADKSCLKPVDRSLAANALWLQGRWAESQAIMGELKDEYPASVRPYADLLMALALERLGQKDDARQAGIALAKSDNSLIQFFGEYLLARVARTPQDVLVHYRKMLKLAGKSSSRRKMALRALAASGGMTADEAYALLSFEGVNAKALEVIKKAPESAKKNYRLGWAAYVAGNNKEAVALLAKVPLKSQWGLLADYTRAVALVRLGQRQDAVPLYASLLTPQGKMVRQACQRLSSLTESKDEETAAAATEALVTAASSDDESLALSALSQLSRRSTDQKEWAQEQLDARFPKSPQTADLYWQRGWEHWIAGEAQEALDAWRRAGECKNWSQLPKVLYWQAQALQKLDEPDEAKKVLKRLTAEDPYSFYSQIAVPDAPLFVERPDGTPDPASPPSDLEKWGFVSHAKLELEGKTSLADRLALARVCRWLGQDDEAFAAVRPLTKALLYGKELPDKKTVQLFWPQAFSGLVKAKAEELSVKPEFIWAIMRQESSFNPSVTSWAGAAGLMQLMPGTAKDEARRLQLKSFSRYNPSDNIALGVSHVAWLMKKFDSLYQTAAAYNAGMGSVTKWNGANSPELSREKWIEEIPFDETREYVKKVLANYGIYQRLTAPAPDPETGSPAGTK
ncbi:lytic transglycosylase domain-containing protein [Jonquetella anthropi]|uniref:lytic transglycosylase domain-containing protein n=1 Tax=Jonquetella anthropi TaxID=428712 RepID=UPI00031718DE|nr:lytic transglycosylase domain-containing protein [Jonquetella anthropi]